MTRPSQDTPAPADSRPRLVIVDDEIALMRALCGTLGEEGFHTSGFASAREALAALPGLGADLLLVDVRMPEMDGIDLLRAAQAFDPSLVGVVMTGEGSVANAVEAMKAGALDYITKPFKLTAILPVLARALSVRQLRLRNAALEQRVRERTAELEAANFDLEAYAYSVSHDLRSPLVAIEGLVGLLRQRLRSSPGDDTEKLLDHMVGSVQRMHKLIEALMRLSRLGQRRLQPGRVRLTELVRSVVAELAQRPEGLNGARVAIAEDLPDVEADPELLRQVFVNLIANATKFARQQPQPLVEIGHRRQEDEDVIFVRDNGVGFDASQADSLFVPFRRLHRGDEFEGSGIGLSLVQRIVQRHGGHIWAESERGHGATFSFTLG
ncbi:MAG TPA: ATP-binding protein [Ideonella sp.]|nr:ATP-binding protein [Ideonella sp.]